MHNPLISILIPVYNCEPYLRECLDSVVAQTYRPLQVVCVNDGSSDGSLSILEEYAAKYDFIEVISQENKGVASARNRLLEAARGEYILFVDADDWIEPDTIEGVVSHINSIESSFIVYYPGNEYRNPIAWDQTKAIEEFIRHQKINGMLWNKLIRREAIGNVRFDDRISYGEDALFIWEILLNCNYIQLVNGNFYHHRPNETGLSASSYGPKKKSSHLVWEKIYNDTITSWPQFTNLAKANFAVCDLWLLYFAASDKYPIDDFLRECQRHVRRNLKAMRKSCLISDRKLLFAHVACRSYGIAKVLTSILG